MDDYGYFDPPIWLGVLLLYVLPIAVNLNGCMKKKRKLAPSLFVSIIYPTGTWIGILLWLYGMFFTISLLNKIELISGAIALILGFLVSNAVLAYPLFYIFDFSNNFFDNFKERGILSIKRQKSKK